MDVSGNVNVSGTITTNNVAIGTVVSGSWLAPTYASSTCQACFSLTVSQGTWFIFGSVIFNAASAGAYVYSSVGPSAANIYQSGMAGYNRTLMNVVAGQYVSIASQNVIVCSTTTTLYLVGMANSTTGAWANDGNGFQAVKIC